MLITELGRIIKSRRKILGITQESLSDLAGVNVNTLIRIENGKVNPSIEVVNAIFEVMGMELKAEIKTNNE
jgi:transcriptional regulator with XRE-family HTH domain